MLIAGSLLLIVIVTVFLIISWQSNNKKSSEVVSNNGNPQLTPEQHEQLLQKLGKASAGTIYVTAFHNDPYSINFAQELNHLLKQSGWRTHEIKPVNFMDNPCGLFITVNSMENAPACAGMLQQALKEVGLPVQAMIDSKMPARMLTLVVGHKLNKN